MAKCKQVSTMKWLKQFFCRHNFRRSDSDHNNDYYQCNKCEKEKIKQLIDQC